MKIAQSMLFTFLLFLIASFTITEINARTKFQDLNNSKPVGQLSARLPGCTDQDPRNCSVAYNRLLRRGTVLQVRKIRLMKQAQSINSILIARQARIALLMQKINTNLTNKQKQIDKEIQKLHLIRINKTATTHQ